MHFRKGRGAHDFTSPCQGEVVPVPDQGTVGRVRDEHTTANNA